MKIQKNIIQFQYNGDDVFRASTASFQKIRSHLNDQGFDLSKAKNYRQTIKVVEIDDEKAKAEIDKFKSIMK